MTSLIPVPFIKKCIHKAMLASTLAYAPYSKFLVGSAIATVNKKIFAGCNIENSSYGLTQCAERVALGNAIANGERTFMLLVVYTVEKAAIYPCGACLQVLSELCGNIPIFLAQSETEYQKVMVNDLFPHPFVFKKEESTKQKARTITFPG